MSDGELDQARADAALARQRLVSAAQALQARLKPAVIANDAWDGVRERGEAAVAKATEAVAARPIAASAAAVGLVALLFRRPLARLFRRKKKTSSQERPVAGGNGDQA